MRFKRLRHAAPRRGRPSLRSGTELLHQAAKNGVLEPFTRLTGQLAVVIPLCPHGPSTDLAGFDSIHPLCAQHGCGLGERWPDHVAALARDPAPHWHHCDCGLWCGVVPLCVEGRPVAACRIVCESTVGEGEFTRYMEILHLLSDRFGRCDASRAVPDSSDSRFEPPPRELHPLVRRAKACVDECLTDPGLSVGEVASRLEANSTYLAHLFSRETGVRMSEYIARRRVQRAVQLLSADHLSIKEIAYACGFRNLSWFGQVFRRHTGHTPTAFRGTLARPPLT